MYNFVRMAPTTTLTMLQVIVLLNALLALLQTQLPLDAWLFAPTSLSPMLKISLVLALLTVPLELLARTKPEFVWTCVLVVLSATHKVIYASLYALTNSSLTK